MPSDQNHAGFLNYFIAEYSQNGLFNLAPEDRTLNTGKRHLKSGLIDGVDPSPGNIASVRDISVGMVADKWNKRSEHFRRPGRLADGRFAEMRIRFGSSRRLSAWLEVPWKRGLLAWRGRAMSYAGGRVSQGGAVPRGGAS